MELGQDEPAPAPKAKAKAKAKVASKPKAKPAAKTSTKAKATPKTKEKKKTADSVDGGSEKNPSKPRPMKRPAAKPDPEEVELFGEEIPADDSEAVDLEEEDKAPLKKPASSKRDAGIL